MHTRTHAHTHTQTCVRAYMHTRTHAPTHTHRHACACTHAPTHTADWLVIVRPSSCKHTSMYKHSTDEWTPTCSSSLLFLQQHHCVCVLSVVFDVACANPICTDDPSFAEIVSASNACRRQSTSVASLFTCRRL